MRIDPIAVPRGQDHLAPSRPAAASLPGYTPSVFSTLPRLLERSDRSEQGSIPDTRSIMDGHYILESAELTRQHHYAAIDLIESPSRVINGIIQ